MRKITTLIGLAIAAALILSSCSHNGYGCHGRSKIITRVR